MSRPRRTAHKPIAMLLAMVLAAVLGACMIEQSRSSTPTPTRLSEESTDLSAPTTTTPRRAAAKPGEARGSAVTLAFGGDVHFEGVLRGRLDRDPKTAFGPIASVLRGADLAMVNLETAITTRGTAQSKSFTFRAPPTAFQALKGAGVDVATMANNHGMDYGVVGLQDSIDAAGQAHFPVVGIGLDADQAFRPYRVTINGQRIAIIGATQVLDDSLASAWTAGDGKPGLASAYQVDRLLGAVRAARRAADTVVVDLHWGKELSRCPIERQRELAPKLVKAGADVVVGSHAHVLLGGGYLGPAYVNYGLGNFVFYASTGETTRSGVLTLTVRGRAVTKSTWTPATISGGIPIPMDDSSADSALANWNELRGCTGLSAEPSASVS